MRSRSERRSTSATIVMRPVFNGRGVAGAQTIDHIGIRGVLSSPIVRRRTEIGLGAPSSSSPLPLPRRLQRDPRSQSGCRRRAGPLTSQVLNSPRPPMRRTTAVMCRHRRSVGGFARGQKPTKRAMRSTRASTRSSPSSRTSATRRRARLLQEFDRRLNTSREVDRRILELAVENTNLKAQRLSFGAAQGRGRRFGPALQELVPSDAGETWRVKALAATAVAGGARGPGAPGAAHRRCRRCRHDRNRGTDGGLRRRCAERARDPLASGPARVENAAREGQRVAGSVRGPEFRRWSRCRAAETRTSLPGPGAEREGEAHRGLRGRLARSGKPWHNAGSSVPGSPH